MKQYVLNLYKFLKARASTQQWYLSYRFADSLQAGSGWNWFGSPESKPNQFHPDPACKLPANLYDIYHCCVYNENFPMMDRGTAWNV